MAISIEGEFEIEAPADRVWAYFQDPVRVAPCLPGAELTRVVDEKTYEGRVRFRVGPVTAQYRGTVLIEQMDGENMTAEMVARGDQQGAPGRAEARLTFSLRPVGEARTQVAFRAQVTIAGALARVGGGMIQAVARQMMRKFAACVQEDLR